MSALRLPARAAALAAWTVACLAALGLGALPALAVGRLARLRARAQHGWSKGVCRILGVRLRVTGRPPTGGCLLVANHLSYVDVIVLGALFPCSFVSKAEVARWPVFGWLARAGGTLFVERERKRALAPLNGRLAARLARGDALVLFPEGTSTSGAEVLPFRPALLEPAVRLGLSVRYAALRYATPAGERPAEEAVCWWGDMTFGPHLLALLRLPGFDATVLFGSEALRAGDRKELAARLRRAVVDRLRNPSAAPCLTAVP
jgi:1-acyl-sn-glycerol-3-phosphate acyltransferase